MIVERDGASIHVIVTGDGPPVVMLPSLGRGASDFAPLSSAVADAGFTALSIDPRGVGDSTGDLDGLTLHDLAADAAAVIGALGHIAGHVVGHAFGQRVARCLAADRPDLVKSVTILAAGGAIEPADHVRRALFNCFDTTRSDDEHIDDVRTAFFAAGNDPTVWVNGWWPDAAIAQGAAVRATARDDWWLGGHAPMLVVQGLEDVTAPVENGRMLAREDPDRIRLVEIEHAAHALLPEQPDVIAGHVVAFLRQIEDA